MHNDEQAIRNLIAEWQSASAAGELERLRDMMAEDVVFLTPGQPPVHGRQAFLEVFEEGLKHYRIASHAEIKEVDIAADLAYCWTKLAVTVTPHEQGLPMRRCGYTLTIFKKRDSRWVLVRDANMLTAQPASAPAERS